MHKQTNIDFVQTGRDFFCTARLRLFLSGFMCLLVSFANAGSATASVIYGNDTEFSGFSGHGAHYLLGHTIFIGEEIQLSAAGIIVKSGASQAVVGLYASDYGDPGELLASTGSFNVTKGTNEAAFIGEPVTVGPGEYWFMAVYDQNLDIGWNAIDYQTGLGPSRDIKYKSLVFGSDLPSDFGSHWTYTGWDFNYYVVGNDGSESQVPEPATLVLLGLGLAGLGFRPKRKKLN